MAVTVERFAGWASGKVVIFRETGAFGRTRRMPLHLEFYGFAVQVERQAGANGEFFGALEGAVDEGLNEGGVAEEVAGEFGVDEDPSSAVETISVVIDLQDRG